MSDLFSPLAWHERPFAALDFEATGVDAFTARPVSCALAIVDAAGTVQSSVASLIDCGVPIPAEATAVHGITDADLKAGGVEPRWATEMIASHLLIARREQMPLCIMNARYDWTLLKAEGARVGIEIVDVDLLDPGLLDKGCDKYRKGKRKLADLCALYGVTLEAAHTASADAVAAARVTRAITKKYPAIFNALAHAGMLAAWQAKVFEEYRRFLTKDGRFTIEPGWPIPERAP